MKIKTILIAIVLLILIALVVYVISRPKFVLQTTHTSPDNKYILEVYTEKGFKPTMSMASESGFAKAYVILKDNKGNILAKPNWIKPCRFIIGDLAIEWQIEQDKVYFTKFNYINLKNNSLDCY